MSRDILEVMQEKMQSFSKGQRRIVQFMLESSDKAAFMTASKLGKTVGVSESTVVRFAVDLGFDGYPAMQKVFQEQVLGRLTAGQRLGEKHDLCDDGDLLSRSLQVDQDCLRRAGETVDRAAFHAAADVIAGANRVYVTGVCSAAPLTRFLGDNLCRTVPDVRTIAASDAAELFEQIMDVAQRDVVIIFSFLNHESAVLVAAEHCRGNGAAVVTITDTPESALAKSSEYVICVQTGKAGGSVGLAAPFSIVNALASAVAAKREQDIMRKKKMLKQLLDRYHQYEKRDENNEL